MGDVPKGAGSKVFKHKLIRSAGPHKSSITAVINQMALFDELTSKLLLRTCWVAVVEIIDCCWNELDSNCCRWISTFSWGDSFSFPPATFLLTETIFCQI